jgi:hypothetical protein
MSAISVHTTVNEPLVRAVPALRPLLGQSVHLTAEVSVAYEAGPRMTWDDFVARHQLRRPPDIPPVSIEDMERAIGDAAIADDA